MASNPLTAAGLSRRTIARNVTRVFACATPQQLDAGLCWYPRAREIAAELAQQGNVTLDTAAIVLAHLSPRTPWSRTVNAARSLLATGVAPGAIGANARRATAALTAPDPWATFSATAPKTRAFARAILGDTDAVVIDIWSARVADIPDPDRILRRTGVYDAVACVYRHVAHRHQLHPSALQAITWTVIRGKPD
ncbi:hypothetical protein HLB23_14125 [Nocardia uniformis]|uniref:Uncharacterized protein n=1 Tax=Nocardia uniformis TaxID=53432 RepID=A0A849C0K1_9NOCA|nr:hypothetical protein [Nocardia uniformis]NNH70986.1 hypothetical protein [Nocardia uniformis]